MPKCDSYYQHGLKFRCYKTLDMLECSCGGDPEKCDHFPERRKEYVKLQELQTRYGMPTVTEAINAYYILRQLADMAAPVEYMHNFQRERSDIYDYIKKTHPIMMILKGDMHD